MKRNYNIRDLRKDTEGMKILNRSFYRQLVTSLGKNEAVRWFYYASIPDLDRKTPRQYIKEKGIEGKKFLASSLYYVLTGQSD